MSSHALARLASEQTPFDQPPEPRRVVHLDQMRHLMDGEIISTNGGARISRQEYDSTPVVEHEPQRLDWSRTEIRLIATPNCSAARRLETSRSRNASRRRKSLTRRSMCGASPATHKQRLAVGACFRPHCAAQAGPVHDAVFARHATAAAYRRRREPPAAGGAAAPRSSRHSSVRNSLASRTLPRGGMVRMISRVAA